MYEKLELPNGLTIIAEEIPHVRSVSCGILVGTGVSQESQENNGISHFVEHMLFKGTKTRSAHEIALTLDELGGRLNAYTDKELTMYYTVVLDSHIDRALDLLLDIFLNSTLKPRDIKLEKQVILEEIKMYQDTPDELIHDLFVSSLWDGHPMGKPILGTEQSVSGIDRTAMQDYIAQTYLPHNIVLSLAGNFAFDDLIPKIESKFKKTHGSDSAKMPVYALPESRSGIKVWEKQTEQAHICLGGPGFIFNDKRRYVLALLNSILGGSMSSRLFQEVREKRGLAYSIYSYQSYFRNAGSYCIYAGTSPSNSRKVLQLMLDELDRISHDGIPEAELRKAKEYLKGNMVLSLESTNSRMGWNAKNYHYHKKILTIEDIFTSIMEIEPADILSVAKDIFDRNNLCLTAIGPFKKKEEHFRGLL